MAIDVQFQLMPVLNVDEKRLAWFTSLDADATRNLKQAIQNQVYGYLKSALHEHSSVLPLPNQILLMIGPLRWKYTSHRYNIVLLSYSTIENIKGVLHLVTHIAITDWRSDLIGEIRDGMKAIGSPMRYNQGNVMISPMGTPLAELITQAIHGLEPDRSKPNEIHPRKDSTG